MVGVAGKSKGCATCRRRKIRCDLEEPFCKKCIQSGRTCEGYARYPVFLNRSLNGLEKRYGLEEAKSAPSSESDLSETQTDKLQAIYSAELTDLRRATDNRMLAQPSFSNAFDQQIISAFWVRYIPSNANAQSGWDCVWLQQVISLANPGEALYCSVKALAMTRLGWINGDQTMALQGNIFYSRALRVLQKALWNEKTMYQDQTFAAAYALSVYELFESTAPSIKGWNSHMSGLGNLVLQRGTTSHQSSLGQAVFEEYRSTSIFQCIQFRKSSFLGTQEWLTVPWQHCHKDVYQKLYDKGFALAALLEEMDHADFRTPESSAPTLSKHLKCCAEMDADLDAWYQELLNESPSPLYWTPESRSAAPSLAESQLNESAKSRTLPPLSFPSLHLAVTTVTFWALKLILSNTLALTCGAVLSARNNQPSVADFMDVDLISTAHNLLALHGTPQRLALATDIMRSMPYCLDDSMGLRAAAKSLFALRTALYSLRRHPGEELKWCQAVYQELDQRKGLRYAREIAKLDGKHSAAGRDELPGSVTSRRGNETPAEEP